MGGQKPLKEKASVWEGIARIVAIWYIFYTTEFEFDPHKSLANHKKHGIDFIEAQALWDDEYLLEVPARTEDEPRSMSLAGFATESGRPSSPAEKSGYASSPCAARGKRNRLYMKAKELDKIFDAGGNITQYLDLARARRVNESPQRVNVDFPVWMIHSLDKEAGRLGVTRQSIIKIWISERLSHRPA